MLQGGTVSDLPLADSYVMYEARRLMTSPKGDLMALTSRGTWKLEGGKLSPSTSIAGLLDPRGVFVDASGQLLIADRGAHKVFIYLP